MAQEDQELLATAAEAIVHGGTLETVTRPFLDVLHSLTGLESTYLTEVDIPQNEQRILFAENRGKISIPEDLTVNWQDTLCRKALETGKRCTSDVEADLPGSEAARALGLQTYISVPVLDHSKQILGTLCGASGEKVEVSTKVLDVMEMLARLIADQWERDRLHQEAEERAAHAEERLRSRALFLAEAEHKLKSPLTLVRGWAETLAEKWEALSEEQRNRALHTIRKASIDATQQIDELLDEARSEVLANQLHPVSILLCDFLKDIAVELNGSSANHEVVCFCEGGSIYADPQSLWQVLWHLGENAMKYSPDGGLITIQSHITSDAVQISVSDEGIGVPLDVDVFAPFTRGPEAKTRNIKGTGLGLHIVRNIAQAMGGTVKAEQRPAPQTGSIFTLTFNK